MMIVAKFYFLSVVAERHASPCDANRVVGTECLAGKSAVYFQKLPEQLPELTETSPLSNKKNHKGRTTNRRSRTRSRCTSRSGVTVVLKFSQTTARSWGLVCADSARSAAASLAEESVRSRSRCFLIAGFSVRGWAW